MVKLIGLLPLIKYAVADVSIMQKNFKEIYTNVTANQPGADRNVQVSIPSFNLFNTYGCWCYFNADGSLQGTLNGRHGAGRPVDEMDEYCRQLTYGYDCLLMESDEEGYVMAEAIDTANNGNACVPWEVSYLPGTGGGFSGINSLCELLNTIINSDDKECAIATCKIESLFVLNILALAGIENGIDSQFHHDEGFVANRQNCPTVVGGGPDDRECCGEYPYKRPYHTRNGANECCTNDGSFVQVFQPLTHFCCLNDRVLPTGEVCL